MQLLADWAAVEGWNPGLDDADCFYAADPDGFMIGLLDEEPIAALSTVRYGETFAFIGFYLVRPDYRGQGYGLQLWKAGLAHLQGRTIGQPEVNQGDRRCAAGAHDGMHVLRVGRNGHLQLR